MNKNLKVLSSAALASALAVPAVAAVAPITADAASTIETIAFEYEGEGYTVDFNEYATQILNEEGAIYEAYASGELNFVALGVGEGVYVEFEAFATAVLNNPDTEALEVLEDLEDDSENLVAEDVVEGWENGFPPSDDEPMVESVSAINLKQLQVEFSGDFDEKLAENVDSYTLEYSNGDEVVINDVTLDGETATITLESAVDNQSELDLTVEEDVTGEEYTQEAISFFDTTIPEVTGAEVAGKDTVKVMFSEPLAVYNNGTAENPEWLTVEGDEDVEDAFEVEGGDYYIKSVDVLKNGTEVNVTTYADLEEGEVEVSVDNMLEDYAGFNVTAETLTVDVVKDEEAPEVVSYKEASPRQVTLVFNEDIQLDEDVTASDFYHTNSNNIVDSYEVNGKELTLTFVGETEDNPLPEGTAYVYVDGESILDLWGNVNENQIRKEVEVTVDETVPTLEDLTVKSGTMLELTFSEDVTATGDDFTLLDKDGEEIENAIKDVTVSGEKVKVETYDTLTGEYALVVDGVEDLSDNDLDKVTESFNVDDTTAPDVDSNATAKVYDANEDIQKIVVNYPEAMALDGKYSVLDLEKYELTGGDLAEDVSLSDVTDASIKALEDGSSVEISIPADETDGGLELTNTTYNLNIGRVADDSGNYTTKFSSSVAVTTPGSVAVDTVEATATDKVVVELQDRLVDFDADDFQLSTTLGSTYDTDNDGKIDISKVDTSLNSSGNTVITFTLDEELPHLLNESGDVTFEVVGNQSVNKYDEPVNQSASVDVQDEINPELAFDADSDETAADAFSNTTSNQIDIEFTEALDPTNEALYAQDLVVLENGERLVPGVDFDTTVSGSTLQIVSGDTTINLEDNTYTVKSKDSIEYIVDTKGNTAEPFTTSVQVEDGVEPVLATTSYEAATAGSTTVDFDTVADDTDAITVTAASTGEASNGITIEFVDETASSASTTASYDSTSKTVTVELQDDGTSVTATASEVATAVDTLAEVSSAPVSSGTGLAAVDTATTADGENAKISIAFSEDMKEATLDSASEITVKDSGETTTRTLGTNPNFTWTAADALEIVLDSDSDVVSGDVVTSTNAKDENDNSVNIAGSDVTID